MVSHYRIWSSRSLTHDTVETALRDTVLPGLRDNKFGPQHKYDTIQEHVAVSPFFIFSFSTNYLTKTQLLKGLHERVKPISQAIETGNIGNIVNTPCPLETTGM